MMAENPATWGEAEKVVQATLSEIADEIDNRGAEGYRIGFSTAKRITLALREAGLLASSDPVAGVYERPVEYAVSILPEDHEHWNVNDRSYWTLYVKRSDQWKGEDKWFVTDGHYLITRTGKWISRYDEGFKMNVRHCYFATAAEALALARMHAAKVAVNGHPATEVLADTERYRATGKGWRERR